MITPGYSLTSTERILPRFSLNFTTALLDSRVTFTRTTSATNPATYVANNGYITSATNNQARFDHDPVTLTCIGLLLEEPRSNLVAASQQAFNNLTYWTKIGGITVSDSSVSSPDGGTTASVATGVYNVTTYLISAQMTVSSSTNYAFSLFIKAGTSVSSRIRIYDGAVSTELAGVVIVWSSGVPSTSLTFGTWVTAPTYRLFKDGWYRVTGVFNSGVQTTAKIFFYPDQTSVGDNTQIYGAQLEAGSFATSYIPTSTGSRTRNADVATITGTNFSDWWQATSGAATISARQISVGGTSPSLQFDDASANNIIALRGNTTNPELYIKATIDQAQIDAGTIAANTNYGLSGAWTTDNCAAAVNGAAAVTDTAATIPTVTQARLGSDGTNYLNGWLQTVRYWPQRITNAETQAFSKL